LQLLGLALDELPKLSIFLFGLVEEL
jgi:hypothetical protein